MRAVFAVVLLAGCATGAPSTEAGSDSPIATAAPTSGTAAPPSPTPARGLLAGSETVEFETAGGLKLAGRLFGTGEIGVVLAHGNRPQTAQAGMYELATKLADAGYSVLTFNFQGFCPAGETAGCSDGLLVAAGLHRDVGAAVDFMRARGTETVFLVGSSLGGTNVLYAAAQPNFEVAGVVAISAPQFPSSGAGPPSLTPDVLQAIDEPKLFIVGENDPGWAADSPAMYEAAAGPKQLEVVPRTNAHGEEMLSGFQDSVINRTTDLILEFLAANS